MILQRIKSVWEANTTVLGNRGYTFKIILHDYDILNWSYLSEFTVDQVKPKATVV